MKKFLTVFLSLLPILPIMAEGDGEDQEQYLDGYDYSLQNYLTAKFNAQKEKVLSAEAADTTTTGKKKWKIADYVTVPKFGGYIVGSYKYDSREGENGGEGFNLRYVRLYVDGTVFKDFKYRVQMEVNGAPGNNTGPRVIDAYIDWQHWDFLGIKLGQYKRCFTFENPYNPWDVGFGNYSQLTKMMSGMGSSTKNPGLSGDTHNNGGRDIGIQLHGSAIKDKKDGHNYLHYQFGVYNGQGINSADKNKDKDFIFNLQVEPIKNLYIGAFGWNGSFCHDTTHELSNDFWRWSVGAKYESRWTFRAEYGRYYGKHHTFDSPSNGVLNSNVDADAWYVVLGVPVWRWIKVYGKYEGYRHDALSYNDLRSIYACCVQLKPHKNLQLQVEYNYDYDKALVKEKRASHQFWVQAYLRF